MSGSDGELFIYVLIDNGLLHDVSAGYAEADAKSRPVWLEPVYAERALEVSPLLIDVEAAYEAGDIEKVMGYMSAAKCLVPCDHFPRRSWPLFRAKAMLDDLIAGFSSPGIQSHQEELAA